MSVGFLLGLGTGVLATMAVQKEREEVQARLPRLTVASLPRVAVGSGDFNYIQHEWQRGSDGIWKRMGRPVRFVKR